MLKKIIPSHRLQVINLDDENVKQRFISFFSNNTINNISSYLEKIENDPKGVNYKIIIRDIKTNKKDSILLSSKLDTNKFKDFLMKKLINDSLAVDIQNTKLQLKIINKKSSETDIKKYCFNTDKKFNEIYNDIKKTFIKYVKNDETVFFNKADKNQTSHYVILSYAGNTVRRKLKSKCMSIKLMNYSSEEILNLARNINEG